MEFSNDTIVKLCDMMISYHAHSFRVRRASLLDIEVPLPLVEELDNLRNRLGNEYDDEDKLMRATGLHEIVSRNRLEIKGLSASAKEADDAKPYLDKAGVLMEELGGATYLLELLHGD